MPEGPVDARCPECGYETVLYDDDLTDNPVGEGLLTVPECPECDPEFVGDPLSPRTTRLEIVAGSVDGRRAIVDG